MQGKGFIILTFLKRTEYLLVNSGNNKELKSEVYFSDGQKTLKNAN